MTSILDEIVNFSDLPMNDNDFKIDRFTFAIRVDQTADALNAIEVWVFFMEEPCCDDNGHQYRFYLPLALKESSLRDLCCAFTKAVHCEQFASAA